MVIALTYVLVSVMIVVVFAIVFFAAIQLVSSHFVKHPIYQSKCVGNHTGFQTTEGNTSYQSSSTC